MIAPLRPLGDSDSLARDRAILPIGDSASHTVGGSDSLDRDRAMSTIGDSA